MNRREFIAASAIFPLIRTQTMAAVCESGTLSGTAYDELLRSVRPIAKGGQLTTEAIDLAITNLAQLDPKQAINGAVLKLIDIVLKDEALIKDIDIFVKDFSGPEAALKILRTQPEVFLGRPPASALSNRLAKVLKRDAAVFLLAAGNLGTDSYRKCLPRNVPVTRAPERMAESKHTKPCLAVLSAIVAVVLVVVSIVVAAFTFGAAGGLVVGAEVLAGAIIGAAVPASKGGIAADELAEVASEIKARIEEAVPERAGFYARHSANTASKGESLKDKDERAACLEASLLLFANAY